MLSRTVAIPGLYQGAANCIHFCDQTNGSGSVQQNGRSDHVKTWVSTWIHRRSSTRRQVAGKCAERHPIAGIFFRSHGKQCCRILVYLFAIFSGVPRRGATEGRQTWTCQLYHAWSRIERQHCKVCNTHRKIWQDVDQTWLFLSHRTKRKGFCCRVQWLL